jgi:hypothetical protein
VRKFFIGKNESLAQAFVETAFKAVFTGVVVAVLAVFAMSSVERSIERSNQRAALNTYKNLSISQTLNEMTTIYTDLNCARDRHLVIMASCKSQLSSFAASLRARNNLLRALFPGEHFRSLENLISAVDALHAASQQEPPTTKAVQTLSDEFSKAVAEVAGNFT